MRNAVCLNVDSTKLWPYSSDNSTVDHCMYLAIKNGCLYVQFKSLESCQCCLDPTTSAISLNISDGWNVYMIQESLKNPEGVEGGDMSTYAGFRQ